MSSRLFMWYILESFLFSSSTKEHIDFQYAQSEDGRLFLMWLIFTFKLVQFLSSRVESYSNGCRSDSWEGWQHAASVSIAHFRRSALRTHRIGYLKNDRIGSSLACPFCNCRMFFWGSVLDYSVSYNDPSGPTLDKVETWSSVSCAITRVQCHWMIFGQ